MNGAKPSQRLGFKWLLYAGSAYGLGLSEETLRRRYWHNHPDYQRGPADAF